MKASDARKALAQLADKKRAEGAARFFKTGPGEYGEGDIFLGITVPAQRVLAKRFRDLPLEEIDALLQSKLHEERSLALFVLSLRAPRDPDACAKLYLARTAYINNWDLVDLSARPVLGDYLLTRSRKVLYRLARSKHLWERRIAIVATFAFIVNGEHEDTFAISALLMRDREDLMHKAVGWMLREVGKRVSEDRLREFLEEHVSVMPRTTLRYAIERFSPKERASWLARPRAAVT